MMIVRNKSSQEAKMLWDHLYSVTSEQAMFGHERCYLKLQQRLKSCQRKWKLSSELKFTKQNQL